MINGENTEQTSCRRRPSIEIIEDAEENRICGAGVEATTTTTKRLFCGYTESQLFDDFTA